MKKIALMLIVIFSSVCSLALAYDEADGSNDMPQMDDEQSDRPMSDMQGMRGGKNMGQMGRKEGMSPKVVATSDGGVVVLMGNKLVKYDSTLTLVKEVEMKGGPKPMNKKPRQDQQPDEPLAEPASESADNYAQP